VPALSTTRARHVKLSLRDAVEERPAEQSGHCVAMWEEIGPGAVGSVGPSAAVAMAVSSPCDVPPTSACPTSPLAVPSTSSESASASSLGTHVFSIRVVTQHPPIEIRSTRGRISPSVTDQLEGPRIRTQGLKSPGSGLFACHSGLNLTHDSSIPIGRRERFISPGGLPIWYASPRSGQEVVSRGK